MKKSYLSQKKVLAIVAVACLFSVLSLSILAYHIARAQIPGVEVGPDHTRTAEAGQTIMYRHTLTNTGTSTDTFLLQVSSTLGWPVRLVGGGYPSGTVLLPIQAASQMTAAFQVSLTVPSNAAGVTEFTVITATSQLSPTVQDTAVDRTIVYSWVYLPFLARRWPPVPSSPVLDPIENTDGDGFYSISWSSADLAETYSLEEDDNPEFSTPTEVYSGTTTSWAVPTAGRVAGTYYYRVRAQNAWGFGAYSNLEGVTVIARIHDEFDDASLGQMWYWVREDPTHWSLTVRPGWLRITSQEGEMWREAGNNVKNILLHSLSESPSSLEITTKLSFNPQTPFQSAGLIIYENDDNYVTLLYGYHTRYGGKSVRFQSEEAAIGFQAGTPLPSPPPTVYLKLVKTDDNYAGYFSLDNLSWTAVGEDVNGIGTISVGLIANNGLGTQAEADADFDYFRLD